MRKISDKGKEALKKYQTTRKGRVLIDNNYYDAYNIEYYADCYNEGNVVGNAIASELKFDCPYTEKFDTFKYEDGVMIQEGISPDYEADYEIIGKTEQKKYTGKNHNKNSDSILCTNAASKVYENLSSYDGYNNVIHYTGNANWSTTNTNAMSDEFIEAITDGDVDVTTMFLIKSATTPTVSFYLGEITGGASYKTLQLYKELDNGWKWYYTTHTIPANPSSTSIRNHIKISDFTNDIYVTKIQTLLSNIPSDYEPYVGSNPSPSPDYPQEIINKSSEIITIKNKDYVVDLGDIELCKIGNYKDKIYKQNEKWFLHKEIKKFELKNTSFYMEASAGTSNYRIASEIIDDILKPNDNYTLPGLFCTHYEEKTADNTWNNIQGISVAQGKRLYIKDDRFNNSTDAQNYINWVNENNPTLYYVLETPINTEITDETLLNQLNNVGKTVYEYVDFGTFHVIDEEDNDGFTKHITGMDNLVLFNKEYVDEENYPSTIYNLLVNICEQAGVELINEEIPNGTNVIDANYFDYQVTLKSVLKAICAISGTYAIIKDDKLKLLLKNETEESFDKDQHAVPVWKRRTYGINQVILGMENVEGEYVLREDAEDIQLNGVHKLVINDNPFAYTQEKRQELIDELYDQVHGFGYLPYEIEGEWFNYLEIGDTIKIDDIDTIVLRINAKSPTALNSTMSAPAIIDSAIEYIDNRESLESKVAKAELIVNKANSSIEANTLLISNIQDDIANNYYTVEQTNELLQSADTGITNTFAKTGGNNLIRNSALLFEDTDGYEFWEGDLLRSTADSVGVISETNTVILTREGAMQQIVVTPGTYTLSFNYKKNVVTSDITFKINEEIQILPDNEDYFEKTISIESTNITIEFSSSANNGYVLYNLMLNKGEMASPYSQHADETTTDTVQISKGITVKSSTTNTTTKLDADGLRTYNNSSGEIVSRNTDSGTYTKNLQVVETAEITGLYISIVNKQTWITGII